MNAMREDNNPRRGKIQTVNGLILKDELGVALSHEHCIVDVSCGFSEPENPAKKQSAHEKLTIYNVGYFRYHALENLDNLILNDEDLAIKELLLFKKAGGQSVVDPTNIDIGRNPQSLRRISNETKLNIIMGSGYYIKGTHDELTINELSVREIADEFVRDILEGVDGTNIRAGIIGEIGCSWPLADTEKKILQASVEAQKLTGAALVIHPGRNENAPKEIINLLKEWTADIDHTVMCHIDRTVFDPENRYAIAEEGCYLSYDLWGNEGYYPETLSITDVPNDAQRISQIRDLINKGYRGNILISHDICYKCRCMAYGGHGYSHILTNGVPAMLKRNITEGDIDAMLIDNPKNCFAFR